MREIYIIGPVYPYRAGIAYCTTALAEELAKTHPVRIVSFSRQYPKRFYPGGDDVDESLRPRTPAGARFLLDVLNPLTWVRTALLLRRERPRVVIVVWWIWVWALPYRVLLSLLPREMRVVLQCHNIGDKEPAWWKRALTNWMLRRGDVLVVHAQSEADDAARRVPAQRIVKTFLPVHELGGAIPSRAEARRRLGIRDDGNVALFFGHVRPFKGLDIALRAWRELRSEVTLLVAGEAWWKGEEEYRSLAAGLERVRFDFRFIPDSEIATYFAASDVVLAPYRIEAQSGVALTAFHFARPVIATRVGGLPEIIEENVNGLLVPPEDPSALARAVDAFFASDADLSAGAAASARKYSWPEYAEIVKRLL
ncbi:MAG: glycosyl transferase group 1 [Acidobacteria bacterium]|nr:glycosyl transferase group 1 [Acidobacteriota bacterium]